jgi:hypothetical protein
MSLTTRLVSVSVHGPATTVFRLEPPKVWANLRSKGEPVSAPVSASHGFEKVAVAVLLKMAYAAEMVLLGPIVYLAEPGAFSACGDTWSLGRRRNHRHRRSTCPAPP